MINKGELLSLIGYKISNIEGIAHNIIIISLNNGRKLTITGRSECVGDEWIDVEVINKE